MPDKREVGVHPLRNSIVTQSMPLFVIIFALHMAIFIHLLSQASARQAVADAGRHYRVVLPNVPAPR